MDHCAHEAEGKDDGDREEAGHELAELVVESVLNVVHRAAGYAAVSIDDAGLLSQHSLSVDGGHSEEGDDPHPGAADEDSAAGTDDVSGTYLSCDRGRQCLEGAEAAVLLAAAQGYVSEHAAPCFAEAPHLNELRSDREIQTAADKQYNEYVV